MLKSKAAWQFTDHQQKDTELKIEDLPINSPITLDLLFERGVTTAEAINEFIYPSLDDLVSPKDLSMIDKATNRIHQAIHLNEKILVYGDYDADGICSTALLLKVLHELGATCDFYIPNRFTEGYGPNEAAFKEAYEKGFNVIITVDTGIASIKEAELAKKLGIDLIITDHHEIQDQLPNAYAIINPKCSPKYTFQDLAGVGVAFKLAEHLLGYFPDHLLDLVAIGTIADLVPLIHDNRIFAYFGLRNLTNTKNIGLQALKEVCNIDGQVTEENVGFLIGPRINAVGRISDAKLAVHLLMTTDQKEATQIAKQIDSINKERQQIVNSIVSEAEKMVNISHKENIIIVAKEGWNEGVLGIVASRLVQKFERPAIVLTYDHDHLQYKGSARSLPAFNMFKNCMRIRDLFTHFGGHSQAAGMTFPAKNLNIIKEKLNIFIQEELSNEDFKQVIEINSSADVSQLNEELFNEINLLAPFGMNNPKPIFHLREIPSEARQIGQLKNHLKLQFLDGKSTLEGIGFGLGHLFHYISPHTEISIVGELGINEWNGVKTPQIIIKDMAIDEWQLFDHRGKRDYDLQPFIKNSKRNLFLQENDLNNDVREMENIEQITYNSNIQSISEVDSIYIFDLPPSLDQLEKIISVSKPDNIHVCFNLEKSTFLNIFPSREDFKWYYALIYHRKRLDLKDDVESIMKSKGWTKEIVHFMTEVFLELKFVAKENEVVQILPNPIKQDLQESLHYKKRIEQIQIEKTLYYSTYKELRKWFDNCMSSNVDTPKEEVMHGL